MSDYVHRVVIPMENAPMEIRCFFDEQPAREEASYWMVAWVERAPLGVWERVEEEQR